MRNWLTECQEARLVQAYQVDEKPYLHLLDFRQQRRAHASRYPQPPADAQQMPSTCAADAQQMIADAHLGVDICVCEGANTGAQQPPPEKTKTFTPPSIQEISAYCAERANGIDPEHFHSYYEARGWFYSKGNKMRDWKAAVRTWEKNSKERAASGAIQTKLPTAEEFLAENEVYKRGVP